MTGVFAALAFAMFVAFVIVGLGADAMEAERDDYHRQLCTARLAAAPTARDTLVVYWSDRFCVEEAK